MKLAELLATAAILVILAGIAAPAVSRAKARLGAKAELMAAQHNWRLEYAASGALEDPRSHGTTEFEAQATLEHVARFDFR